MGSCILSLTMSPLLHLLLLAAGSWAGPVAPAAAGNTSSTAGCDGDYGWLPGVEGSGKCYMLVKDYNQCGGDFYYGMDWFDALACCYLQRGYLAEPTSEEEQTKINTYLTISNGGNVQNTWWIGGIDLHQEGVWTWMSGAPWSYEHWGEGEPNQNGNEDCLAIDPQNTNYGWMDLSCAGDNVVPRYAVCEKIVEGFFLRYERFVFQRIALAEIRPS